MTRNVQMPMFVDRHCPIFFKTPKLPFAIDQNGTLSSKITKLSAALRPVSVQPKVPVCISRGSTRFALPRWAYTGKRS
jgi:hypothetical protein